MGSLAKKILTKYNEESVDAMLDDINPLVDTETELGAQPDTSNITPDDFIQRHSADIVAYYNQDYYKMDDDEGKMSVIKDFCDMQGYDEFNWSDEEWSYVIDKIYWTSPLD